MALVASDVMDLSASTYLMDPSKKLYTYARLLPYLKLAHQDLQFVLALNNATNQKEINADVDIAAGADEYTPLPDDFFLPVKLEEKSPSETDDFFVKMHEGTWEPSKTPGISLGLWAFRDNVIKFPPSTQERTVRLFYYRTLITITGNNTPIEFDHALQYLAARTAEHAARFLGNNAVKAGEIAASATLPAKNDLETLLVRNGQGKRVRRKPFSSSRRRAGVV